MGNVEVVAIGVVFECEPFWDLDVVCTTLWELSRVTQVDTERLDQLLIVTSFVKENGVVESLII